MVPPWQGPTFACPAKDAPPSVALMVDEKATDVGQSVIPRGSRSLTKHELGGRQVELLLENEVQCCHCSCVHPEFGVALNVKEMSQ